MLLDADIGGLLWPFIIAALLLCTARARFETFVVGRILTLYSLFIMDLLDLTRMH